MTIGSVPGLVGSWQIVLGPMGPYNDFDFYFKVNVKSLKFLSRGEDHIVTSILQATEGISGKSLIRLLMRGGFQHSELERIVVWIGMLIMKTVGAVVL